MAEPVDNAALRELYERYGRAVLRRCEYFLRDRAAAEDAMHDVFEKVVRRYGEFKGESSPLTWMVRIATNHCLNLLRASKAGWKDRYELTVQVDLAHRPLETSRLERHELVRAVLAKVDPKAQEAAVYYFVDEMTQEDAAAAAGCSVPTLRKRLREFVRVARRELQRDDSDLVFGEEPI
jgi:RNA polymerase sigma-70 factor (ECF subfamily)